MSFENQPNKKIQPSTKPQQSFKTVQEIGFYNKYLFMAG